MIRGRVICLILLIRLIISRLLVIDMSFRMMCLRPLIGMKEVLKLLRKKWFIKAVNLTNKTHLFHSKGDWCTSKNLITSLLDFMEMQLCLRVCRIPVLLLKTLLQLALAMDQLEFLTHWMKLSLNLLLLKKWNKILCLVLICKDVKVIYLFML